MVHGNNLICIWCGTHPHEFRKLHLFRVAEELRKVAAIIDTSDDDTVLGPYAYDAYVTVAHNLESLSIAPSK